ncbi:MAG TPA: HEAT repeat domain-containing protein, partial [Actinophytocola sp.]|uniref:HEAT repeat domain-containing protein n=1 Tax=Actinophytocola sp. TaxID=1872138 RepID=UPI002DDCAD45
DMAALQPDSHTGLVASDSLSIPFYVPLSDWQDTDMSAESFLRAHLESLLSPANYLVRNFDRLVAAGRFLLVLDGLNELPGRKAHRQEGCHENQEPDGLDALRPRAVGSIDPRERSLRDFAQARALRTHFVLSCRSHEYFDSLRWQVIRVLPMNATQIDRFIDAYLEPDKALPLHESMHSNTALADIATNPFFLASIIEIYRPGLRLESRGQIMTLLLRGMLERDWLRSERGDATDVEDILQERSRMVRTVGRVAFGMLDARRVGNQAPIGELRDRERTAVQDMANTGLLFERDGEYYFRHQIVQEFFAAMALRTRTVRRRPAKLLVDARWSEVVALWYDLEPEPVYRKVVRSLRAHNPPWRFPRSHGGAALAFYQFTTSLVFVVFASLYIADLILGPARALPLLFGWVSVNPLVILIVLLGIRIPWSWLAWNRRVIPNAAYVLTLTQRPSAIAEIVSVQRRLFHQERVEVAKSVARMGPVATPIVVQGLRSKKWRIRAGCVRILGEITYVHPEDTAAADALIAVAHVDDPKVSRSLAEALIRCRDPRTPEAVTALIERSRNDNPLVAQYRLQPLGEEARVLDSSWTQDVVVAKLETFSRPERTLIERQISLRLMGALRFPGTEERLRAVAANRQEPPPIRQAAVVGLGFIQSQEAVKWLLWLASLPGLEQQVANAVRGLRNPEVVGVLTDPPFQIPWQIRIAVAAALGSIKSPAALAGLFAMAEDDDEDVRTAVARALGGVGEADAVPVLAALARDPNGGVRSAALEALHDNYADLAGPELLALAADPTYKDRLRLIRLISRRPTAGTRDGLQRLAGDLDRSVRSAAQRALRRLDAQARRRGRRRSAWRHPIAALLAYLSSIFHINGIRQMFRDEKAAGTPGSQIYYNIQKQVSADAELTRRYRATLQLVLYFFFAMYVTAIILFFLMLRALLLMAGVALDNWKILVGVLVLSAVTQFRRLDDVRVLGRMVIALRWLSGLAAVVILTGLAIYIWWIWLTILLVLALIGAASALSARRRRTRRWRQSAALAMVAADSARVAEPLPEPEPKPEPMIMAGTGAGDQSVVSAHPTFGSSDVVGDEQDSR